jgi:DMSO/TMAO reductase YedYZ molybdopterin-dependent catalytic subunit
MNAVAQPSASVDVLFRRHLSANIGDSLGRLAHHSRSTAYQSVPVSDMSDPRDFRLTVSGLCSRTHQFSLNVLRDIFELRQIHGNSTSSGLQTWTGCSLGELLEFVGHSGQATDILLVGSKRDSSNDPHEHSAVLMPFDSAINENIIVAWSLDGNSLISTRKGSEAGFGPVDAIIATDSHTHRIPGLSRIMLTTVAS